MEQLSDQIKPELSSSLSSLILATDITRQQEFLNRFKRYLNDDELDMRNPEHRHFILQIALKCADISNPCRPWDVSRKWSYKVCEEFFRQGDYERQLNLPITAICDRNTTSIPKIQVGFIKFVVLPLYDEWHRFLNDNFSRELMNNLHDNQRHWEVLLQKELTTASNNSQQQQSNLEQTESQIETTVDVSEDDSVSLGELSIPRSVGLEPPPQDNRIDGRRHSVPLGVCLRSLVPRPTTVRRESLPGGASRISSRSSLQRSEASPSAGLTNSSMSPAAPERPVSAENLLPDTSIASIANSLEASKLSSLVQQQQQQQHTW